VFGIGWTEFVVIALAFLIFLGPKEIPRVFNKAGRLMRELNAASRELRNQLEVELRDIPTPQKIADEVGAEVAAAAAEPYAEMRALDAELRRDVGDLEGEAKAEPALPEGEKGEGRATGAGTGGHGG
jgi:Tat protein translocase TatB subunit